MIGASSPITKGTHLFGLFHIITHAIGIPRNGTFAVLIIILYECGSIPAVGRYDFVGQTGDILAGKLWNIERGQR